MPLRKPGEADVVARRPDGDRRFLLPDGALRTWTGGRAHRRSEPAAETRPVWVTIDTTRLSEVKPVAADSSGWQETARGLEGENLSSQLAAEVTHGEVHGAVGPGGAPSPGLL